MTEWKWGVQILAVIASTCLAGCLPDVQSPKTRAGVEQPPHSAPTISGSPVTSATAGTTWQFRPSANDVDGDPLVFSATGLPGWISLDARSGLLTGIPSESDVGTTSSIVIAVSDGTDSAYLSAFSIVVRSAALQNRPPIISGTPLTTASVGSPYRFRPSARDPEGGALTWSVAGKPVDATFSPITGELVWTPSETGRWDNIVISVTDSGNATASLPAFSISVTAAPRTGTATLSWAPPVQYTDGSVLPPSELSAYRIYRGPSATSLSPIAEVDGGATVFTAPDLPAGTHYFAVTAVSALGSESEFSAVGSKTIL